MALRKQTSVELENIRKVIQLAEMHNGYEEQLGKNTHFGKAAGYNSHSWTGSFVDVIFHEAGVAIPSCVYTPSGLAEFIRLGRFHTKNPRVGDIAFLAVPVGGGLFSQPQIGVLSDLSSHATTGQVGIIEGESLSGLTKGGVAKTVGVYKRVRSAHDILGYGRPDYRAKPKVSNTDLPLISCDNIRAPRRNQDIGLVQQALRKTVGLSLKHVTVDLWDNSTANAYAHFQRTLGYVGPDADGKADLRSLNKLGSMTGLFTVKN
jgi:hypothetical protein